MRLKDKIAIAVYSLGLFALPAFANAHAFGQQYTLPLPFQYYALGASCALLVSFLFLAFYDSPRSAPSVDGSAFPIKGWNAIVFLLRAVGLLGLAGTLICAFIGRQDFILNPVPELFWDILLLGFTYLSVFIGGLWRLVNPFETIAQLAFSKKSEPIMRYPQWLGYIPALIFYYALIWLELLSGGAGALPSVIGYVLIGYLAISVVGAGLFGVEEWFTHGDFFTVFFGLVGLFAPISIEEGVRIQMPAERLVRERTTDLSLLLFILLMLASTAFDGLEETTIWWQMLYHSVFQMQIYPLERMLIFLVSPFIFFALYALTVWLMKLLTKSSAAFPELLTRFAFSLVPIAIAYNFAHYFTLFVNGFQALLVMASDPLAKGWNIFGTAHNAINIGLIGAKEVWYSQFSAIVLGHIVATYVAHRIAASEFSSRRQILIGQLPMLLLMVFYTVFGLWILSQGYQTGI